MSSLEGHIHVPDHLAISGLHNLKVILQTTNPLVSTFDIEFLFFGDIYKWSTLLNGLIDHVTNSLVVCMKHHSNLDHPTISGPH